MKQKNKLKPEKRVKLIEIRGLGGFLKLGFIGICLAAGFGVFPGVALMYLWNLLLAANTTLPAIGILQGLLLYGILVIIYFIHNRPRFSISCGSFSEMSDEELENIIMKAKLDAEKRMKMANFDIFQSKLEEIEKNNTEEQEEKNDKKEV